MIKVDNLQKRVPMAGGELEILKGITLEIKSGQSAAIVGAFSAVEHLKTVLGVGTPRDFPSELRLTTKP